MAEERDLALARAAESEDVDTTKAELQRRMEEARESITQTVTEIKDTVTNQYYAVKDTVTEALDWREQFRKRPVAFSVGALSAGFILGYAVGGTFLGDGDDEYEEEDYLSYEESDAFSATGAQPAKLAAAPSPYAQRGLAKNYSAPSEGAHAASSGAYGSTEYRSSTSGEAQSSATEEEGAAEADKPGLIERFKETRAYDKLQEEVASLGDRFIEELSTAARTIVLPALFSKVKEMFGVDLSGKQRGQSQGAASTSSSGGRSASGTASSSGASAAGAAAGSSSSSGGASYATSENRGYQTPSPDRA